MALKASGIEDYPGRPPTHYSLSGLLAGIVSKKCFLVVWFHLSGWRIEEHRNWGIDVKVTQQTEIGISAGDLPRNFSRGE